MLFLKTGHKFLSLIILSGLYMALASSCSKQEELWNFHISPQDTLPPATGKDTVISVTALLNNDTFKALGRAEPPAGKLEIAFLDLSSDAYLVVALGADTLGTYSLGRDIASSTAVWYDELGKTFTSRATDEAGGQVTISEIDTVKHRIKGSFDLLLLSRTDSSRYQLDGGNFDILYNHISLSIDSTALEVALTETIKTNALKAGTATEPTPDFALTLNDSLTLNMSITSYTGLGDYNIEDGSKIFMQVVDLKNEVVYTAASGAIELIRYNYGEFIQLLFHSTLRSEDGKEITITSGSIVIGI